MVREAKAVRRRALKIEYEPDVDILTIYLKAPRTGLSHSSEAKSGVVLNYAGNGSLVSVEILDASRRYSPEQLAACSVDEFLDMSTASRLSGIARVTLRTQAEKGRLSAMKLGGQWVTTRQQLQHYLDSRARVKKSVS
jgi:uncharacterized protein YuzE